MRYQKASIQNKYPVLLWIVFLFFTLSPGYGQFTIPPAPKKPTSVYDEAKLLSKAEKNALTAKLFAYADTTSTQIVVYTVPSIKGENIGILAPRWAHEWGIGDAEKDNGVFILLASKERKVWIAPGYGVEDKLTAGTTGSLVREVIIPEFKKGDFYAGLDKGTTAIIDILAGTYTQENDYSSNQDFPFDFIFPFIIFIVILIILSRRNRNKGGGSGGRRSAGIDLWDMIILSNMGKGGSSSSSGGFGGGSFGGGSFGGGFGGGGFSGGGAGGSW